LSGGMAWSGLVPELFAATSASLDLLPNDRDGELSERVDIGRVRPLGAVTAGEGKPLLTGNPLWSIPLSVLTATRERPIFSASRRPPQPAVVATHLDPVAPPPPLQVAEPLSLALIGAVVGDSDAIAVFLNRADQKIIRLRQGESHAGWMLSSVQPREVTLNKADRTEVLALQRTGATASGPADVELPGRTVPTAGVVSYAPFVPHSTPKNGESDGL
jgi:general secretion pathway protein N